MAQVIANQTKSKFKPLNAVSAGIKEVRELLGEARANLETHGERTILFLDEMHRFNKAQQDVLLPDVEEGVITLIGATTQNPFFAINSPLLSRSQVFTFEPLTKDHIKTIVKRALADKERGLGELPIHMHDDALEFLAEMSDGDARRALMALEIGVKSSTETPIEFTLQVAQDSIQRKLIDFDPTGDAHYDLASAFIKSMRGSDPDAAIYWLARMLEAGEDPRFIARRIVILASEDIGNADPQALLVATAAWNAVEMVGLPECQLTLVASSHVHGHGAEIERRHDRHRQSPQRRPRRPHAAGPQAPSRFPLQRRRIVRARRRLPIQPRLRRCDCRSGVSARRKKVLRTDGSGF